MISHTHRQTLRFVMRAAWDASREAVRQGERRTFADCLRGAWAMHKRWNAQAASFTRRTAGTVRIDFSPLVASPIRAAMAGRAFATPLARKAGYLTSRLGN